MTSKPTALQADEIVEAERARRPGWRDSATRRAPAWFRGEELDLAEPTERRALYLAATGKLGPAPWTLHLAALFGVAMIVRAHGLHGDPWRSWSCIAGAVVWAVGSLASTLLRRRLIRRFGREALRESADWPQRQGC